MIALKVWDKFDLTAVCIFVALVLLRVYFAVGKSCGACERLRRRSERRVTWQWCMHLWLCSYCVYVYFAASKSCGACEWLQWRSEIWLTWQCGIVVLFSVGRCCFHLWIRGIRNLCKLFIHFKYCRESSLTWSGHMQTSNGGGVCGSASIACVFCRL